MLHVIVGLLDNSAHTDSYMAYTMSIYIYNHGEWLGWVLKLQAINAFRQKRVQSCETRSLVQRYCGGSRVLRHCSPAHIHVVTMHEYKTIMMVLIGSVRRITVLPM